MTRVCETHTCPWHSQQLSYSHMTYQINDVYTCIYLYIIYIRTCMNIVDRRACMMIAVQFEWKYIFKLRTTASFWGKFGPEIPIEWIWPKGGREVMRLRASERICKLHIVDKLYGIHRNHRTGVFVGWHHLVPSILLRCFLSSNFWIKCPNIHSLFICSYCIRISEHTDRHRHDS